jgi:hypothetical protein
MPGRLPARSERPGGFRDRAEGDREYRRGGAEKKVGPGSDFKPEFVCLLELRDPFLFPFSIVVNWLPAE